MIKPKRLERGDVVAIVTLSWGGAAVFPERLEMGIDVLKEMGLQVVEPPHTRKSPEFIYDHPEARLEDLRWALKNPDVNGIVSIIGGTDVVRVLDLMDSSFIECIRNNPKVFVGFSDTTAVNFAFFKAGVASFYGPSVLFGLPENTGPSEYTVEHFKKALFSEKPIGHIHPADEGWIIDFHSFDKNDVARKRQPRMELEFFGTGNASGTLIGGCMEAVEMYKGTSFWPKASAWKKAVLFLETSEMCPPPVQVGLWLRNYGLMGVLADLAGLCFGIPSAEIPVDSPDYDEKIATHRKLIVEYEEQIMKVLAEFGREDMPVVTRVPFGHTCPMITIPFGATATIDATNKLFSITSRGTQ